MPAALAILETHGGKGQIFRSVYSDVETGIVMEADGIKCDVLARQRPSWSVYQCKAEAALEAGFAADLKCNLIDVDPYGEPWPTLEAFFTTERVRAPVIGVVVNDGLRQRLELQGGWSVRSMRQAVERFGNLNLHKRYLEVCEFKLGQLATLAGYEITHWTGYYCGKGDDMTHYAAVFRRKRATRSQQKAA